MFQRSGSIIAYHDIKKHVLDTHDDIKNTPIVLSIVVNGPQKRASGFVYLEEGAESEGQTEMIEVRTE
jgi:hypothetical protein